MENFNRATQRPLLKLYWFSAGISSPHRLCSANPSARHLPMVMIRRPPLLEQGYYTGLLTKLGDENASRQAQFSAKVNSLSSIDLRHFLTWKKLRMRCWAFWADWWGSPGSQHHPNLIQPIIAVPIPIYTVLHRRLRPRTKQSPLHRHPCPIWSRSLSHRVALHVIAIANLVGPSTLALPLLQSTPACKGTPKLGQDYTRIIIYRGKGSKELG